MKPCYALGLWSHNSRVDPRISCSSSPIAQHLEGIDVAWRSARMAPVSH